MNVTNDYEPPAYLTHRAKRRGRQLDLAAALAATAALPRADEVTVDAVLQMRGHVTIEEGVLTFSDGATLNLAELVRERGAPVRAVQAHLAADIGSIEQFLVYSVQAGALEAWTRARRTGPCTIS